MNLIYVFSKTIQMNTKPINILLVDDHQLVLDGIKSMLSKNKIYQVKNEASNGKIALEMMSKSVEPIDLVITDITMPVINGIALCKEIKTQFPSIKVIILSMHNDITNVKEAIAAEADGYILKNIGQTEFIKGVDRVMDNGTYFSQDILPLVLKQIAKNKNADIKLSLTNREEEVLSLIMQEYTSKEIAEKLFISKQTVDTHRLNIMQKTGCKTLVGLIKYALDEIK